MLVIGRNDNGYVCGYHVHNDDENDDENDDDDGDDDVGDDDD